MFKFHTRIVDDLQYLSEIPVQEFDLARSAIYGEVELNYAGFSLSMIEAPEIDEAPPQGTEDLTGWFSCFLDMLLCLCQGKQYVAVRQLDYNLIWLTAERKQDRLILSTAKDAGIKMANHRCDFTYALMGDIYTEKPAALIADAERSDSVLFKEFSSQIVAETERFLELLRGINPNLEKTRMYLQYQACLSQLDMAMHPSSKGVSK